MDPYKGKQMQYPTNRCEISGKYSGEKERTELEIKF
jgi:hypothetical protein